MFLAGCSDGDVIPASARDRLEPGTTYSADLDGDGGAEQILIQGHPASLTIFDGETTYRSRDRWQIVEAHLGDTDRDGLLEVVTLVDDEQGRHLGLFAYFGGEYRERLVTDEIDPRPVALQVVASGSVAEGTVTAPGAATDPAGDMILLTLEPAAGQTGTQTVLCRWNGFGFTGIEPGP
ncbi:MAG: hypothetical protein JW990_08670 [Thermoleophilia bacterium]|nr:hypothetical protein [Thermoleophilia bacterium]